MQSFFRRSLTCSAAACDACLQVRAMFELLQEPEWLVQDASQGIDQIHQQVGLLSAANV